MGAIVFWGLVILTGLVTGMGGTGFLVFLVLMVASCLLWKERLPADLRQQLGVLEETLVIGSVGFWVLLALMSGFILYCMETEWGLGATISLLLAALLLQAFGNVQVFTYIRNRPWRSLVLVAVYFLVGAFYSAGKWWLFVSDQRERYDELRVEFLKEKNVSGDVMPDILKKEWLGVIQRNDLEKPDPKDHKPRIMVWISYWPWSLVWTVLDDFVKRVVREIYQILQNAYRWIADSVYKEVDKDLPSLAPPVPAEATGDTKSKK